nr:EAL domain-containing protein [Mycolicibacterium sphagni]
MTDFSDQAIAGEGLVAAFQQVVELPSEVVVGYEALARWPSLDNPSPIDIFYRAAQTGRLDRLDELCIRAATQGAAERNFTPGSLLLVNCEPVTPTVDADVVSAAGAFRLTFEITERGLLTNPRHCCARSRRCGRSGMRSHWTTSAPTLIRWYCSTSSRPTFSSSRDPRPGQLVRYSRRGDQPVGTVRVACAAGSVARRASFDDGAGHRGPAHPDGAQADSDCPVPPHRGFRRHRAERPDRPCHLASR